MKIEVKQPKSYPYVITINPQNYNTDCYNCNCLRYCYIHKHGVSKTPNLKLIEAIRS